MSTGPRSTAVRWLEPLDAALWPLFLIWSGLVALTWCLGLGEVEISTAVRIPGLREALLFLSRTLDAIWLTLAAANTYVAIAARERLGTARRWAALLFGAPFVIAACSAALGMPLGPVHYTERLGMKLGPVPFALPLLFFVTVLGAGDAVSRLWPRASHTLVAAGTALGVLLTHINLEPLAWKIRAWWLWYPANLHAPSHPPLMSYLTWAALALGCSLAMRSTRMAVPRAHGAARLWIIFAVLNLVFLLTHVSGWLRR